MTTPPPPTTLDLDADVGDLSWADVDPSRTLAPDRARAEALALDALMATPRTAGWRDRVTPAVRRAFAHAWGPWTAGWTQAHNDGGVVRAWCCTGHSVCLRDDADPEAATAARAAEALLEWRAWLVRLAALFEELDAREDGGAGSPASLASAAARLVDVVVDATGANDAWYGTCAQVLRWFLEHQGADPRDVDGLVERAVGGRFESWVRPDAAARHEVTQLIGDGAAHAIAPPARRGTP